MKDFNLIEMSEEMLHEVVGAQQAIHCTSDQTLTITQHADGSFDAQCD
ncbi:MAG: hypothetical protein M3Y70_04035 [Pseudomonadota bacterium]|nr:hypothetical protein [Pseudomonadota bacterium]